MYAVESSSVPSHTNTLSRLFHDHFPRETGQPLALFASPIIPDCWHVHPPLWLLQGGT